MNTDEALAREQLDVTERANLTLAKSLNEAMSIVKEVALGAGKPWLVPADITRHAAEILAKYEGRTAS